MPADPIRQRFRAQQAEDELLEANRLVTMAVHWQLPDGSTLLHAGGVWDKLDRCYLRREPDIVKVFRLKTSQVESAQWIAWWLQERADGRSPDVFNINMEGDRGGGKTVVLVAAANTALIKFPLFDGKTSICWMVSSSFRERNELEREQSEHFPFQGLWYTHRKAPEYEYRYVNGAVLRNMSADDPENIKQGRVDFLMLNEMAKMQEAVYLNGVGRLKDKDGLCLGATNPPRTNRGRWVFDLWERAKDAVEAGLTYPVKFIKVDSDQNEAINHEAANKIARVVRDMNPDYAKADIDGEMLRVGKPAYGKFNKQLNQRSLPDLGDITREYLKLRTGRAYDYLGGMDFQGRPHMVAVVCKIFGTLEDPQLYFCDEIICPQATEEDLADECKDAGYEVGNILWIGDASGQWQNGKHLKHEHDSFKEIAKAGFHILPPVKPKTREHRPANPPIEQRVGLINKGLTAPWIFVDSRYAPKLADGLARCDCKPDRRGHIVPMGYHAHITDAAGYPTWWVYSKGRRKLNGSIGESVPIERKSPIG